MTLYRTMAILQGESNMPEDRFVNTFHFVHDDVLGTLTADVDSIHARLLEFYNTNVQPENRSVISYVPASVITSTIEFRTYNLADPTPRQPIIDTAGITPGATVALPTEVAACISYFHERNIPRQRGRIFVGPLTTESGADNVAGRGMTPTDTFVNVLLHAAGRLSAYNAVNELSWCVYSRTNGQARRVTGGWVDNAYDTQRRRGTDATGRGLWGDAIPA